MNTAAFSAGAKLRQRREAVYLSQRQLSVLADVAQQTVQSYEAGQIPRHYKSEALVRVEAVLSELEAEQAADTGGARPDPRTAVR